MSAGGIEGARREEGERAYGILCVDDEPAILEALEMTLGDGYRLFTATSGERGLELLEREEIALVIADQVMPGMTGVQLLEQVAARRPDTIRMLLTGYADVGALVRAINDGRIYRYVQKPWETDELRLDVKRALEAFELGVANARLAEQLAEANEKLRSENLFLRREVERRYAFDQIIGASPAMNRVFSVIEKVAETDATVLLTGETGTGKDLVARAIHWHSARREGRFVAQNCGALPETLLESELFGHKRGAFTGAMQDKKGLFELADGGTIFLDEIGETSPTMQVRLLRVLQDGELRPLGSGETIKVNVRVIAATNRDLRKEVQEGRFREDLFYRLRVVEIPLPPLRERRTDIPALAHHFLDRATARMGRSLRGFTQAAMDRLLGHVWSGNVRELENEIERIVALAGDATVVSAEMLSEDVRGPTPQIALPETEGPEAWDLNQSLDALKKRMIEGAIARTGSKSRAAELLGIPRQSLQKMMKRLGMKGGDEG
ncbi:MAG TPA: sigma-54 dependent transcriptional regulator [Myxococcota bacterium]|jgi:two-component system response regulator HupR/HoxA|nr:sigma-54 dependent transcriptional regulator [Myxococcota bacterium]